MKGFGLITYLKIFIACGVLSGCEQSEHANLITATYSVLGAASLMSASPLHPKFGNSQVNTPCPGRSEDKIKAVAIQLDGKFVVAGESHNSFALARYNPDGTLDTGFGGGGIVITHVASNGYNAANDLAIQSDGKIVVVGFSAFDFGLVRYNPDGALDTSFGQNGKVITDFGGEETAEAIVIQSDGKIVVAGTRMEPTIPYQYDFVLARYNNDGSLDTSFGSTGKVITNFLDDDTAKAIAIQFDGKIVVAGEGHRNFALARYNNDGTLDTSFGHKGKVITDFAGSEAAEDVVIQNDGKIVVVGWRDSGTYQVALARYNPDGTLDVSFGQEGRVTTEFGGRYDISHGVKIQSDGKIVVAGASDGKGDHGNFALARYNNDGTLDTSFGTGGKIITDFGALSVGEAIVIQSDGKIVAAGLSESLLCRDSSFALARYNNDGTLDTSFGRTGKVTTDF